jgi:hypothetical protein
MSEPLGASPQFS